MEIFFPELGEPPLPQDAVRIRDLRVEPWNNGQGVRVSVEIDPFLRRPNLDFSIQDAEGQEMTSASVLETMTYKVSLVMHLRGTAPPGRYTLKATLFYTDIPEDSAQTEEVHPEIKNTITDTVEIAFDL